MPNQPHATMPRATAGILAPVGPKEERSSTGKGMPYLVPAWPTSTIGISTMALAARMVSTA